MKKSSPKEKNMTEDSPSLEEYCCDDINMESNGDEICDDINDSDEFEITEGNTDDDNDAVNEEDSEYHHKSKENLAWADAMAKILKTNKPKRRKTIVLSKAKRANQVKTTETTTEEEKLDFEIEGEGQTVIKTELGQSEDNKQPTLNTRLKKKEWASKGYVKPSVLERDREKALLKTATRGVVQLFNTVREHQKTLQKDLGDAGLVEHKKDKVFKSLDKRAFLDVLMGPAKSQPVSNLIPKEIKEDPDNPTWSVLRDDFMMGSKLKDWDKEVQEDT